MRKIILVIAGLAIIAGAVLIARSMISQRSFPAPRADKKETAVFSQTVINEDVPLKITTGGNLSAKDRLQLFAEVQGLFEYSARAFKPGNYYRKGEVLIRINADEFDANIRSQKSALNNQLVQLLPDLRLDYPESFEQWQDYLADFDVNETLKPFPKPKTEREKLLIAARNIYSSYYTIKNLEERRKKFSITAPFNGMVTEALVTPGTLVRPGQMLGTFINPLVHEIEIPLQLSYTDFVKPGQEVKITNLEGTKSWTGRVIRINSIVNPTTQTVPVFIEVRGDGLREGMYVKTTLEGRQIENAFEVSRKLLMEDKIFVIRDSLLVMHQINPVYYKEASVIVRGIPDSTQILARAVPGAYEGMKVQVLSDAASKDATQ